MTSWGSSIEGETLSGRIRAFQAYISSQHAKKAESWSLAQAMIQSIGETISTRVSESPPLNLQAAAAFLNIQVVARTTSSQSHHGSLVPVTGGFRATVFSESVERDSDQSGLEVNDLSDVTLKLSRRGRFTIAHEFGHALFYTTSKDHVPRRVIPAPPVRGQSHWREEGLCHAFARALLVPSAWGHAVGQEPSFRALIEASSLFRVSGEALIHRLLYDWRAWRNVVIIHVSFSNKSPNVRVFRGIDRSGEKSFTKGQIEKLVNTAPDVEEVATLLVTRLRLTHRSVLARKRSVWVMT